MPNKNINTNTNKNSANNNIKINIDLGDKVPKRKKAKRSVPAPPPPPVQNVNVYPLNSTFIPGNGLGIPEYFTTALTNQTMSMAAMANAMQRMVNNDYNNVVATAGNVVGGNVPSSSASEMAGEAAMSREQAAVNNPTQVEEDVVFGAQAPEPQPEPRPQPAPVPEMNNNPLYEESRVNPQDLPLPDDDPIEPPDNPRIRRREGGVVRGWDEVDEIYNRFKNAPTRSANNTGEERAHALAELRETARSFNIDIRNTSGAYKSAGSLRREIKDALRNAEQ